VPTGGQLCLDYASLATKPICVFGAGGNMLNENQKGPLGAQALKGVRDLERR
jgi:hypothetical protein